MANEPDHAECLIEGLLKMDLKEGCEVCKEYEGERGWEL
jgi:hypothetical protein